MNLVAKIKQIAEEHPGAMAISNGLQKISYAELVQKMNGLSHALRKNQVGPGTRVIIGLPRSPEMIISILAVLSTGAAYIPADTINPLSRIERIAADAQPSLAICNKETAPLFVSNNIPVLYVEEWPAGSDDPGITEGKTAYIIYTSGSTGKPKGVVISMKALDNYLEWALGQLPFTGGGVPLFTSFSFDLIVTCLFPPLMKGETLVLLPQTEGGHKLSDSLLGYEGLLHKPYSYVKITPSLFSFLNKAERAALGNSTSLLMFGGEKLPGHLVADARKDNALLRIINHYGPTETTVGCCVYEVPADSDWVNVPIGKPIPGMKAIIRAGDTPDPDTGELLIAGTGLAEGYWNNEEQTRHSFVMQEDEKGTALRWYRTGDIVKRVAQGFECLGRKDGQIKLLGNRIEPAEIEAALLKQPDIEQCCVLLTERKGFPELAALAATQDERTTANLLRNALRNLLPPAMIPSRIVLVKTIPLAAGGKLDIKQAASILQEQVNSAANTEDAVLEKIRELTGIADAKKDDDYFELGGDSIGTAEIAAWASVQFGVDVELAAMFDHSTAALFAEHILTLQGSNA